MIRPQLLRTLLLFAPILIGLLGAGTALAQEGPGGPGRAETAETGEPVPTAVPPAAILVRVGETDRLLQRITELAKPDPAIAAIAEALQAESEALDRKRLELDRIDRNTVTERTLTDQRERWERSEARLDVWSTELQARWQALIELRASAIFERDTWRLTRESVIEADLGAEMLAGINDYLTLLEDGLETLRPRIDATTELLNRTGRRIDRVIEAYDEIESLTAEIRARIFRRDRAPLWRVPVAGSEFLVDEIVAAGAYWWRTGTDWSAAHAGDLIALALAFLFYGAVTMSLRGFRKTWEGDARLEVATFVVSRPLATASLSALATGLFIVEPMTGPVRDLFSLVALGAVVRLGPGLSHPLPRQTFRGLLGLYLLDVLLGFVPDGSLLGRLLLLVMGIVGAVVWTHALRRWPSGLGWLWSWARVGMAAGAILFGLGAGANILGWVDLGRTLISGTTVAGLAAIAWMMLVRIVRGLLPLLQVSVVGATFGSLRERQFERAVMVPISIIALYGWLTGALRNFRLLNQFEAWWARLMESSMTVGSLEISVGGVLGAIVILIVTTFVARIVKFVLAAEVFPRTTVRPGTASTLVSLINYILIAVGVVMAATAAGFNATQLTVVVGAMSVGIGFGLQAVVGNFVSGLILLFERPVAVGDQVEAGGFVGKVTHIGIRASQVRTFDGSELIIPNSELVTKQVLNWTLTDGLKRVNLDLAVGLDSNPREVMEILNAIAGDHELVLEEPTPRSLMLGYGDSSINFRLQVWLRVENAIAVPSELHLEIIEKLRSAGVEIPAVRRERHENPDRKPAPPAPSGHADDGAAGDGEPSAG